MEVEDCIYLFIIYLSSFQTSWKKQCKCWLHIDYSVLLYRVVLSLEAPNYCLMRNTGKCKSLDESIISQGGSMLFSIVAGMSI